MLKVEKLEVYGLSPVSLDLAKGQCIAIQGPSGSGKTLLLRAIADLDPAAGDVFVGDTACRSITGPEWRRRVRYSASEPGWWAETARAHFADTPELDKCVKSLGLSPSQLDQSISQLSTGERQRLALIRATIDRPDVLLLDEPTGALDAKATAQAERLMKSLLKSGKSIILVSHDPAQVRRIAHKKLVIRAGKLVAGRL